MIETIQHMNQSQARCFLESAFDCSIPPELLAFVRTLPKAPALDDEDAPLSLAEQRAALWADIRAIWRPQNRWETHWDHARWHRLGLKGALDDWKRRRRMTSRLLERIADVKAAEKMAAKIVRAA